MAIVEVSPKGLFALSVVVTLTTLPVIAILRKKSCKWHSVRTMYTAVGCLGRELQGGWESRDTPMAFLESASKSLSAVTVVTHARTVISSPPLTESKGAIDKAGKNVWTSIAIAVAAAITKRKLPAYEIGPKSTRCHFRNASTNIGTPSRKSSAPVTKPHSTGAAVEKLLDSRIRISHSVVDREGLCE